LLLPCSDLPETFLEEAGAQHLRSVAEVAALISQSLTLITHFEDVAFFGSDKQKFGAN
jgi:hypothetical protein